MTLLHIRASKNCSLIILLEDARVREMRFNRPAVCFGYRDPSPSSEPAKGVRCASLFLASALF